MNKRILAIPHVRKNIESNNIKILKEITFPLISINIMLLIKANNITILETKQISNDIFKVSNKSRDKWIDRKLNNIIDFEIKMLMFEILRNL